MSALTAVERPDGRVYRPRKAPCFLEFEGFDEYSYGGVVVRTHDVELAKQLANYPTDFAFTAGWYTTSPGGYGGTFMQMCNKADGSEQRSYPCVWVTR